MVKSQKRSHVCSSDLCYFEMPSKRSEENVERERWLWGKQGRGRQGVSLRREYLIPHYSPFGSEAEIHAIPQNTTLPFSRSDGPM